VNISIVVPVYRSQSILPHLVAKIHDVFRESAREFELILVNDVSPDESWQVIQDLCVKYPFVKGVCLSKNVGQHNAIMAGLTEATGEIVVLMDDDLQHPPESISSLVEAIESGYDVCYTKYANRSHAAWKKAGSWFNDRVATFLLNKPSGLYLSSFKAMNRNVACQAICYDGPYPYVDGLILDITSNIGVVTIQHQARFEGKGNYNLRSSLSLWLKMATSFSVVPLRLATILGLFLTITSAVGIVLIIARKLFTPEIAAGWASLIVVVLFVGGIQTFCLGMLGEYLGRTYLKVNKKPQFVVRKKTF
jgi:polyisoprenyl-phosphate glycosyltransferase